MCGSLRRWDKGGFCREVKEFAFVVDELSIKGLGRGRGWDIRHNWRTLQLDETPASLLLLANLLTRIKKAEEDVTNKMLDIRRRLVGKVEDVDLSEDVVEIIDEKVEGEKSFSYIVEESRLFVSRILCDWRASSWVRSQTMTTRLCGIGLTKTGIRVSGMSVSRLSSIGNLVVFRSSSSVVGLARKR